MSTPLGLSRTKGRICREVRDGPTVDRPNGAVVIGAGIVGAASAYYLARDGFRVDVLEAATIASGATGLASGGIRSQFAFPAETQLTLRTQQLWRQFERLHGIDLGYRQVGYLTIATDAGTAAELRRRRAFQDALGLTVRELGTAELQELLPGIRTDDVQVAVFTPLDGFGSPADVTNALLTEARAAGARLRQHAAVDSITTAGGAVAGVLMADGERIDCDIVVNAAGLGAPRISATVGLHTPVSAYRQHQFLTEPVPDLPVERLPNLLEPSRDLYLRGEGAGVLLGVADPAEAGRTDTTVTWSLLEALGERLEQRWPRLASAGIARGWVGCYEVTPDRRAMIGASRQVPGFLYAAGFSGHGFMHGMAAGEAIAHLASGSPPAVDIAELSLDRFAGQRASA
jgi:sarcosine oxidase subunit beta